jgi:hypothetical protein
MFCPQCGKEIPDVSRYCVHCGNSVPEPNGSAPVAAQPLAAPSASGAGPSEAQRNRKDVHTHRVTKAIRIVGAAAVGLVAVLVWDAYSEVQDIEAADRELHKSIAPLQKFIEEGDGVAMGCFNKPYSTGLSTPGLGFGPSSLADNPKLQALNNYMKSVSDVAHATEEVVVSQERYVNVKWPIVPSSVGFVPWLKPRFMKARADFDSRIAWAKNELSDHSCAKRLDARK